MCVRVRACGCVWQTVNPERWCSIEASPTMASGIEMSFLILLAEGKAFFPPNFREGHR